MTGQPETSTEYSNTPLLPELLQSQGMGSTGNKFTNVFMPNPQHAQLQFTSQQKVPEIFHKNYPLAALLVESKRALGIESDMESWINNNEFHLCLLLERIGYGYLAGLEVLGHIYCREGQRTKNGFERDHQVMQKTLSDERLTTVSQPNKTSFWSKIGKFGQGKQKINMPSIPGGQ